jgi:hypothetical protein
MNTYATNDGRVAAGVVDGCLEANATGKGSGAWGSGIAITGMDWASFLKYQHLVHSMSVLSSCHHNA